MKFNSILLLSALIFFPGCGCDSDSRDYRQDMRNFVQNIAEYARETDPGFIVIPQNGIELVTTDGEESGNPDAEYLSAIDGVGQEDLLYGYDNDDVATPAEDSTYLMGFLDVAEANGVQVLVTDYCWTKEYVDKSYTDNNTKGYISFVANHRELDAIPAYPSPISGNNTNNITSLADAKNFLYIINPSAYASKANFIAAIDATNYDVFIIDLFYNDIQLTAGDITALKTKPLGQTRLVICYMSIGEAEDYRYYWKSSWESFPPSWLDEENPDWEGNYKVRYWMGDWQAIIFGSSNAYLDRIIAAGFDGVYLDIIEAFEYYE